MTKFERAAQIWSVLVSAAHNRQVLTYEIVADMIGMGPPGKGAGTLSPPLGVIMHYCNANTLPPLTVLVVNKTSGQPGKGLKTIQELHADRERVFNNKWHESLPPQVAELQRKTVETTKLKTQALPPKEFDRFVVGLSEDRMPGKHRNWTGNDQSARNHHGKVRLSEDPLSLRLRWKAGPRTRPRLVGNFELKLRRLLRHDYVRAEGNGLVRLRFYHGDDDIIYLKRGLSWPGIPVGRFRGTEV